MGLEEIQKLTDLFADNFMIRGEETEDLKEALRRAPDSLIDIMWEKITDKESAGEVGRQQKEESLYEDIPGYFESRFELLDVAKINLLLRIMNCDLLSAVEAAEVTSKFVPYGWVFSFVENGSSSLVVMKEVQDIIRTVEEPEVKERIVLMHGIRCAVRTCLALYGVCTLEQICNVFLHEAGRENGAEELMKSLGNVVQECFPYLEDEGLLWLDGKYIVSPFLESKKDYRDLLRRQDQNYYVPDFEMIKHYGSGDILVRNEEYEAVFKLLTKEIKDQEEAEDMLEEISGYVTREDWSIPEIMDCLYDWDVTFSSDKAVGKLTEALSRWLYTIRRWSEGGYSRQELHKENTELQYAAYAAKNKASKEIEKKVYPNDPCLADPGRNIRSAVGENKQGTGTEKEAVMARTVGIGIQDFAKMIDIKL